jgi:nucleotide-binding universal stress UspA family protein
MTLKHLLVHLDGGDRTLERLELAVTLARRFGARLTGLFADERDVGPRAGKRPLQRWRDGAQAAAAAFDSKTRAASLEAERWQIPNGELEVAGIAARYCRYADLAIVGQHDPEDPRVAADFSAQVLLESGRPVLVVPSAGRYPDLGQRVVVAWDGSREAARALNDAIPLLRGAEKVHVAVLLAARARIGREDPAKPSVVRHLAAHGIAAEQAPLFVDDKGRDGGIAALDGLLNLGSDLAADLVVMGARGRHGVPFPRAGRRTRESLASMTAPVLFSL